MVFSQIRYLNPVNKSMGKIRNVYNEFAKQLTYKGVKDPVHKKDYAKIEKQNHVSINVFGYENETPYHIYTSKQTFGKQVDLLPFSNSNNSHYFLIKDFNKFMTDKTKYHGKKHFYRYCLQYFFS